MPPGKDAQFLKQLTNLKTAGAEVLGFHLEGPFLVKTGALPPEAIGKADESRVRALIKAAEPYKLIFSTSPDFERITDLLPIMTQNGVPAFITHTQAGVKDTQAAIEGGARHATHFYDVFYAPAESDPGVRPCGAVEAILADKRVSVDFILDGEHVDPVAVKMAIACKGPDKVCLITDANKGAGNPPGRYKALGTEIEFRYPGAPARMTENSLYPGALAGSGLTMDRAVKNAVAMLGADIPMAIRMASANPADVIGLKNKGKVAAGFDADILMLDRDLNVMKTFVGGRCCYTV
jgi:N-acetylglucosamine-6-phosphate deacetylase